MPAQWSGNQKIAVVPTFNKQFDTLPPSADWDNLVMRRVLYDPDPQTGIDRSLRAYLNALSYGAAVIEPHLFPHAISDGPAVIEAAWQSLPPGHGCPYVLCVIPFFDGDVNRKGFFETVGQNGVTAVSRVAMFDFLTLQRPQPTGVWAMEILHAIVGWPDLYKAHGPQMGNFDNMTFTGGMHSCAHLKLSSGWLAPNQVADHPGGLHNYQLHSIGLSSPPPSRFAAVRVRSATTGNTFLIEARLKSDVYETGFSRLVDGNLEFVGIPGEGVIVYQTHDDLQETWFLGGPFGVGQSYNNPAEGFSLNVTAAIDGGMTVQVSGGLHVAVVPDVLHMQSNLAGNLVTKAGLVPKFSQDPTPQLVVSTQAPSPGAKVAQGSTVTMTFKKGANQ